MKSNQGSGPIRKKKKNNVLLDVNPFLLVLRKTILYDVISHIRNEEKTTLTTTQKEKLTVLARQSLNNSDQLSSRKKRKGNIFT